MVFESTSDLIPGGNTDDTEEIYILLADDCLLITVPTLSEWGLIALASVLGIIGFVVIRRRQFSVSID